MKVLDVIVFFAQLKGMDAKTAASEAGVWLERMGLADRAQSKVETLSKGMQQKVQFIATVLHRPDMLILDEPQSGLDPVNQEVLRDTILEARNDGRTVVLSTHNMSQAEAMCEHVCIIANGRKILDGRVQELRRAHRGDHYSVEFDFASGSVDRFMETSPLLASRARNGSVWEIEPRAGVDSRRLVTELAALDAPVDAVRARRAFAARDLRPAGRRGERHRDGSGVRCVKSGSSSSGSSSSGCAPAPS